MPFRQKRARPSGCMSGEATRTLGVLVDRDGTLIREVGYLSRLEQIEVLPRVAESIQLLRQRKLKVVVITNQSAVARGFITEEKLRQIHRELEKQLARHGAFLDGIYYCPHHPREGLDPYRISCDCRKPNVGLAKRAAAELNLDLSRSYMIGDQPSDMELASRIGAKGILIKGEGGEHREKSGSPAFLVARDFWEAAQWVIEELDGKR